MRHWPNMEGWSTIRRNDVTAVEFHYWPDAGWRDGCTNISVRCLASQLKACNFSWTRACGR